MTSSGVDRGASFWQSRFLDLTLFFQHYRRAPSGLSEDPAERRLGRWLEIQRRRAVEGTLPLVMVDQMESIIPGFPGTPNIPVKAGQ